MTKSPSLRETSPSLPDQWLDFPHRPSRVEVSSLAEGIGDGVLTLSSLGLSQRQPFLTTYLPDLKGQRPTQHSRPWKVAQRSQYCPVLMAKHSMASASLPSIPSSPGCTLTPTPGTPGSFIPCTLPRPFVPVLLSPWNVPPNLFQAVPQNPEDVIAPSLKSP